MAGACPRCEKNTGVEIGETLLNSPRRQKELLEDRSKVCRSNIKIVFGWLGAEVGHSRSTKNGEEVITYCQYSP